MTGEKRRLIHNEFRATINRHSIENDSNTPDYMLADYLVACLDAWNETTQSREKFYGREARPIPVSEWPKEKTFDPNPPSRCRDDHRP